MLKFLVIFYFLLQLLLTTVCFPEQWLHTIYVNNSTGANGSSCWKSGYSSPCRSLNIALTGAQMYNNSTAIILQPGKYSLEKYIQFWNRSQLAIIGNGTASEILIECQPLVGIAFFQSSDIYLQHISLIGCGADSLLTNYTSLFYKDCTNVILLQVWFNGTSMVLENSVGLIKVQNCIFSGNQQTDIAYGLVVIPYSGNNKSMILTVTNTNFSLINYSSFAQSVTSGGALLVAFNEGVANHAVLLQNVSFTKNVASLGGGVYLSFIGNSTNNTVVFKDCHFTGNKAETSKSFWQRIRGGGGGGGIYIYFDSATKMWPSGNVVTINSSLFLSNEARYGSGIALEVLHNLDMHIDTLNSLLIDNCIFDHNIGYQGSSVYLSQANQYPTLIKTTLSHCHFKDNYCKDITNYSVFCSGTLHLQFYSIEFSEIIAFSNTHQSAVKMHSSALVLDKGTHLSFTSNNALQGAALHITDCSSITVNRNTSLLFVNNTAIYKGGAIYSANCDDSIMNQCFIKYTDESIHPNYWNASFTFMNNKVMYPFTLKGTIANSIYMDSVCSCTRNSPLSNNTFCWTGWYYEDGNGSTDCLQQLLSGYANINAPKQITVFPGESIDLSFQLVDEWNRKIVDPNFFDLIAYIESGPAQILDSDSKHIVSYTKLFKSNNIMLVTDCSTTYWLQSSTLVVSSVLYKIITAIEIHFKPCIDAIPSGWLIYSGLHQIPCDKWGCFLLAQHKQPIHLSDTVKVPESQCISADNQSGYLGDCPSSFRSSIGQLQIHDLIHAYSLNNLSNLTCAPHRRGKLCSDCEEGYGVAFNDPFLTCIKCQSYTGIIWLMLVGVLPVIVMIIFIAVFHIKITCGGMNGFVLYSQLLTAGVPFPSYPSWVPTPTVDLIPCNLYAIFIPTLIYRIWNLDFLSQLTPCFCIHSAQKAENAISLQYAIAFLPLVFIALSYYWVHLYNNGYRCIICITRPVHQILARFWQKTKIQPSLIDTYAGLIMLSFMRILSVSAKLLIPTYVFSLTDFTIAFYYNANIGYFRGAHLVYGVVALMFIIVFVFFPIIVLLFYHLNCFQKCLSLCRLDKQRLHVLVDTFQGCFKNKATDGIERRYFSALYLLFRLHIYLIFLPYKITFYESVTNHVTNVTINSQQSFQPRLLVQLTSSVLMGASIALFRPYKELKYNAIDLFLFVNLSMMSLLAIIREKTFTFLIEIAFSAFPVIALICHFTYCVTKWICCTCSKPSSLSQVREEQIETTEEQPLIQPTRSVVEIDYENDELFADHVSQPSIYNIQNSD